MVIVGVISLQGPPRIFFQSSCYKGSKPYAKAVCRDLAYFWLRCSPLLFRGLHLENIRRCDFVAFQSDAGFILLLLQREAAVRFVYALWEGAGASVEILLWCCTSQVG